MSSRVFCELPILLSLAVRVLVTQKGKVPVDSECREKIGKVGKSQGKS